VIISWRAYQKRTSADFVYNSYKKPMLEEVRYEFAQVFLEQHSYTPLEKCLAEVRDKGCFTSPYQA